MGEAMNLPMPLKSPVHHPIPEAFGLYLFVLWRVSGMWRGNNMPRIPAVLQPGLFHEIFNQNAICFVKFQFGNELQMHLSTDVQFLYHPLHPLVSVYGERVKRLVAIQFLDGIPRLRPNSVILKVGFEQLDGLV